MDTIDTAGGTMLEKRRLVDEFLSLVQIDSESGHEGRIVAYVKEKLERYGCEVTCDEANKTTGSETGNLIARLPAHAPVESSPFFEAPFLLCAHLDTVSPGTGVLPKVRDGVIHSSGKTILGADDKAGIAIALELLRTIKERELPHPPLEIVFTVCEETGLAGSRALDFETLQAKHGLAMDAGKLGSIVVGGPFKALLDVEIRGVAAHSARPQKGINAIQVAAEGVRKMRIGLIDDETTCNIATFRCSGPINIIPDFVELQLEVRSAEQEKMMAHIQHLNKCINEGAASFTIDVDDTTKRPVVSSKTTRLYDGYSIADDFPLVTRVIEASERLDIIPEIVRGMGGSDASHFFSKGISVVNLGVGQQDAHTTNESIETYDLFKAARLVLRVVSGH